MAIIFRLTLESVPEFIITRVSKKNIDNQRKMYRSAELARLAGISPDTLRFYERKGLLPKPPRLKNNYRQYPSSALNRVQLIQSALSIGFSTEELAFILKERDAGGTPCTKVRYLAQQKLGELTKEIRHLVGQRESLQQILQEWDHQLQGNSCRPARLLESLKFPPSRRQKRLVKRSGERS